MPMTQQAYLAEAGTLCPCCQSDNLDARNLYIAVSGDAQRAVACEDCGAEWIDTFALTSYSDLKEAS